MTKTFSGIDKVATHYGFETREATPLHIDSQGYYEPEEKISLIKSHLLNDLQRGDAVSMIYSTLKNIDANRYKKRTSPFKNSNLDIVGVPHSIAEAIIIQTAVVALVEEGFKNVTVDINSVGDKESFFLFKNELFNYYKSKVNELHPKCRDINKKNILDLLNCNHPECQALKTEAPKSIYFLSENSQRHLKEVLEHLESTNIAYRLNDSLISPNNFFSKIIFEIKSKGDEGNEEIILGRGGRYDESAKKIMRNKESTAVGISLEIKNHPIKESGICPFHQKKSKFYFIQFGPKAKLRSLSIMELLRQSGLTVQQNIYLNKFSEQIEMAKKSETPYAIILGQREVTDNTIIVKDLRRASQKTICINDLLPYLRQLK